MGTYVSLETYVYYSDATGGPLIQIARGSDSKLTAERRSASTAAWSTWTQDIKAISDGLAKKLKLRHFHHLIQKYRLLMGKFLHKHRVLLLCKLRLEGILLQFNRLLKVLMVLKLNNF